MKKSELRQIIREELSKSLKEQTNTGLITFEQLKQACILEYGNYLKGMGEDSENFYGTPEEFTKDEFSEASNIDELVNILDGLGFNGNEAYDFIFDAILK